MTTIMINWKVLILFIYSLCHGHGHQFVESGEWRTPGGGEGEGRQKLTSVTLLCVVLRDGRPRIADEDTIDSLNASLCPNLSRKGARRERRPPYSIPLLSQAALRYFLLRAVWRAT